MITNLPPKIILHIASFIKREYLDQDFLDDIEDEINEGIDHPEFDHLKELFEENGADGCYYPLRNLYATCKSFRYLSELEYICIEEGELYYDIITRNINGVAHGMVYNGTYNTGILGYSLYENGIAIKENYRFNDYHYHYRRVNGILYCEDDECNRWYCNCSDECKNCQQLNIIQKEVFEKDPFIERVFKDNHDGCTVIIRTPLKLSLTLDYNCDNLKLFST
jgi:hypothetical protein